jgi:hypothetical protein
MPELDVYLRLLTLGVMLGCLAYVLYEALADDGDD